MPWPKASRSRAGDEICREASPGLRSCAELRPFSVRLSELSTNRNVAETQVCFVAARGETVGLGYLVVEPIADRLARLEESLSVLDAATRETQGASNDDPVFLASIGWRSG